MSTVYKEFCGVCPAWKYYLKAEDSQTAKCKLCKSVIKTTGRSTKGLTVHLKSKHKIEAATTPDGVGTPDGGGSASTATSSTASTSSPSTLARSHCETQVPQSSTPAKKHKMTDHFPSETNTVDKRVARMVSKDGFPFRVFCTSSDLRDLFKAGGYNLPKSPNSIKLMVMNYGTTLKMTVIKDLQKLRGSDHRFTLTFDEWTSTRNRRYINVNVHAFVKEKPIFWNLGLVRIYGSLPAEACITILKEKLSEYELSLDKDIVCITTDGAKVMVKVGKLIKPDQQLCYAHGIQLAVVDVIYKQQISSNEEISMQNETVGERVDENVEDDIENDENDTFDLSFPTPVNEVNLAVEYVEVIKKVRKIVKLFKHSPTKNDLLQTYMEKDMGKSFSLLLDCKTRWSSLCQMVTIFNKAKLCVSKTLVDLGLGANLDYIFTEQEYDVLMDLERILQPVKLAVEVLCRRESNLITAETTLRFVISKLKDIKTHLAEKLVDSLRKRISERQINSTAVLLYLYDPNKYDEDKSQFIYDETFSLPSKSVLRKAIKALVERLYTENDSEATADPDDDIPLANLEENTAEAAEPMSLQDELEMTLTSVKSSGSTVQRPRSTNTSHLEARIKQEMNHFESGGSKGPYLQFAYNALITIVPTSVEAERAFSAAGYLVSNIRSRLSDNTINTLTFLRSHFQNNV